jgi:hypothetical protein
LDRTQAERFNNAAFLSLLRVFRLGQDLPYRKERNPNANRQGQFARKKYGENSQKITSFLI